MAYNGSGTFVRLYNWVTDRNAGVKIQAVRMDAELDGIATGLSNAVTKDGQTTITANIPFNNKKITGLGDATVDTDALNRQSADARYAKITDIDEYLSASNYAETDVASATTCDIGAAITPRVRITGTTTITSFGTDTNTLRFVRFAAALTLTHNATTLILPGGANITTVAGDCGIFASDASGYWRCLAWLPTSYVPGTLNVSATSRILGRKTSGSGQHEECTLTEILDFIGSAAQGDILYRGASAWARLAAGTSGQFLQTQGAGANPQYATALLPAGGQTLTGGFYASAYNLGTLSGSATYTPDPINGQFQRAVNGGAHTLNPLATDGSVVIQVTNNASAGAVTTSGFTRVIGSFTTTNGDDFLLYITRINGFSSLYIQALQ